MSDNPLEMTPERQGRIDARATQMWEAEGSPPGRLDSIVSARTNCSAWRTPAPPASSPTP